jgi:hypothetical protein
LLTSTEAWPNSEAHVKRLTRIKGISDVTALSLVDS